MGKPRLARATLVAANVAAAVLGLSATSVLAANVTFDRLVNADKEPQNWLIYHRSYDGQHYSPLAVINKDNIKNLKLAFAVPLGGTKGNEYLEASPLVDNGFMYTTDGNGVVYKIDVSSGTSGRIVWHMDPTQERNGANRGVALLGNVVVSVASGPSRVIGTNADTGEAIWEVNVQDQAPAGPGGAPLALKDRVIVGVAGAESGLRGWLQALNIADGKPQWKTYTIPAPGEPGAETWKDDHNAWKAGGGSTWFTGTFDPAANALFWGIGNPGPDLDPTYRPGDNLFTNSVLSLNPDSGKINFYFQYTPNDRWDFDAVGTQILVDTMINGVNRKIVTHSARNGFLYAVDRTNGQFIAGGAYLENINWTAGLDPKTGKPVEYTPNSGVQLYSGKASPTPADILKTVCPGISGGNNFFPSSYSPKTNLIYIPGLRGCQTTKMDVTAHTAEKGFRGGEWAVSERSESDIVAADPAAGKVATRKAFAYPNYSGALATAGGLVFTGLMDGNFVALDDTTLAPLWTMNLGAGYTTPPMSFGVGGKQFVVIATGPSSIAKGKLVRTPELGEMRSATVLYVFSL